MALRMADVDWTAKRMARLRKLCARKDLSFGDIANLLSREWGIVVPRNGCIGKAHRMGIKRRAGPGHRPAHQQPSEPVSEPMPQIWPRWRVEFANIARPQPTDGKIRYELHQLDGNMCHWPYGDRAPYWFCGQATNGRSYCAFHTGIACGQKMVRDRVMA